MRMAYLGLFDKVFQWVFDRILQPVINVVASVIGTVLEWIFNNVLAPVLTLVIQTVVPWLIELWKTLYCIQLYNWMKYFCKVIDYIQTAFNVFIGISEVSYKDSHGAAVKSSLLNALMSQSLINKAFWIVTALGIGIAMILCIYATIKSTLDFDFENKRPVGAVMKSMLKCFFQFLTVPFFTLFLLKLATLVMQTINTALLTSSGLKPGSLGRVIFCIASMDAAKDSRYNISSGATGIDYLTAGPRAAYYTGGPNGKDYMQMSQVTKDFILADFDFFLGMFIAVFLGIILFICCITFIQRIFEIMILYLVSPLFVSTMPIDDGEKFKKWREMFIAKVFGGYGSVVAMDLYLMLCPVILGNDISWGASGTSTEASYLIKIVFLVGGAWAMLKIGPMVTQLLSYQAGMAEEQTGAMVTGYIGQKISEGGKKLTNLAGRALSAKISIGVGKKEGSGNKMNNAQKPKGNLNPSVGVGPKPGLTGPKDKLGRRYTISGKMAEQYKPRNIVPLKAPKDSLGRRMAISGEQYRPKNLSVATTSDSSKWKVGTIDKTGISSVEQSGSKVSASSIPMIGAHRARAATYSGGSFSASSGVSGSTGSYSSGSSTSGSTGSYSSGSSTSGSTGSYSSDSSTSGSTGSYSSGSSASGSTGSFSASSGVTGGTGSVKSVTTGKVGEAAKNKSGKF